MIRNVISRLAWMRLYTKVSFKSNGTHLHLGSL